MRISFVLHRPKLILTVCPHIVHSKQVWWTGDNVNLAQAVATMVEQGVSALKPFVHSDCGGDYRAKNGGDGSRDL